MELEKENIPVYRKGMDNNKENTPTYKRASSKRENLDVIYEFAYDENDSAERKINKRKYKRRNARRPKNNQPRVRRKVLCPKNDQVKSKCKKKNADNPVVVPCKKESEESKNNDCSLNFTIQEDLTLDSEEEFLGFSFSPVKSTPVCTKSTSVHIFHSPASPEIFPIDIPPSPSCDQIQLKSGDIVPNNSNKNSFDEYNGVSEYLGELSAPSPNNTTIESRDQNQLKSEEIVCNNSIKHSSDEYYGFSDSLGELSPDIDRNESVTMKPDQVQIIHKPSAPEMNLSIREIQAMLENSCSGLETSSFEADLSATGNIEDTCTIYDTSTFTDDDLPIVHYGKLQRRSYSNPRPRRKCLKNCVEEKWSFDDTQTLEETVSDATKKQNARTQRKKKAADKKEHAFEKLAESLNSKFQQIEQFQLAVE